MHELFHILSHAGNCHGEITIWIPMVASVLDGLPFIGSWLNLRAKRPTGRKQD